jgi:hypothetical protein
MKEQFIKFLKKHHYYKRFVENLQLGGIKSDKKVRITPTTLDKFVIVSSTSTPRNPSFYITQAFRWTATPYSQGYYYWERANNKWLKFLKEYQNKH